MPLEFVRTKQQLLWNNGTRLSIPGVFLDKGTAPIGSTWARNPIPRIDWGSGGTQPAFGGSCISPQGHRTAGCVNFKPPCEEGLWDNGKDGMLPWRKIDATAPADDVQGYCSGDWTGGQIVDEVVIPANLPKGEYVVGWRWDWCVDIILLVGLVAATPRLTCLAVRAARRRRRFGRRVETSRSSEDTTVWVPCWRECSFGISVRGSVCHPAPHHFITERHALLRALPQRLNFLSFLSTRWRTWRRRAQKRMENSRAHTKRCTHL